jgi:hypothetical protein
MGTTPSGLRYPEPTDPVSAGAVNIKNLATDLDPYPRGLLAHTNYPGGDLTSGNILTTTVTVPGTGQRRLRVHVQVQGSQLTVAATGNLTIYGGGVAGPRLYPAALVTGTAYEWQGFGDFVASPGAFTAYVGVLVSAGTLRVTAGNVSFLTIEDVGKQF